MTSAAVTGSPADFDDRDSYVTVRECARMLNISEERVFELAERGTLRACAGLVQPALIPGVTG